MDRWLTRLLRAIALISVVAFLTGCAPEPATTEGARVKALYDTFMVAAVVVFALVAGLIGWSIVRYRARDDGREASTAHGNIGLEVAWWSLPTLLVIGLFILTAQVLATVDRRTDDPPLTVTVTGFQWQWQFAYADTDVVLTGSTDGGPELVLPVGERIAFDLESPDVIHAFWVPQFLIKRDIIPGKTNRIELTIQEPGTYRGQCAEFCGLLHDRMTFSIRAVPADEFRTWLSQQGGGG